jgi:hypothetical protein
VSWSNAPRPETRQRRSLRLGGSQGQGLFGTCSLLQLPSASRKDSSHGCDGGGHAENLLSHGVRSRGQHCCSGRVTLLASHRPTHCDLDPYFDVPNTRAIVTFYFGARVSAVSPSPVHASTLVTSDTPTPAALAVARSQQTGCRHGTKDCVLEAQGGQSLSLHSKAPSFPAHRQRVLVGCGSPALLQQPARNIIYCSPCSRACCDRSSTPSLTDDPRSFLGSHYLRATRRARGFCVLLPGWLYILYEPLVIPVPSLANWTFHARFHYRCSPKGRLKTPPCTPAWPEQPRPSSHARSPGSSSLAAWTLFGPGSVGPDLTPHDPPLRLQTRTL